MSANSMVSADDDEKEREYLPARMINEYTYCPRLFYLEHVEGLFADNADTLEGSQRHQRVDSKADALPTDLVAGEKVHARSVTLSSDQYEVIAKLDLVEANGTRTTPVEYKRGRPKTMEDGSLGCWPPERVQMGVQALVLRDNGYQCDQAVVFFHETRQRVTIPIDQALIAETLEAIEGARRTRTQSLMPPPLINSPKCPRCSLVSICLPDETTRCAQTLAGEETAGQLYLFDTGPRFQRSQNGEETNQPAVRQLLTVRDERRPLYLNTQGYSVGISGQVLRVKDKTKLIQEIRLTDTNQVNLFGSIQVSTQAVQALLRADIPLVYFSFGGWFHGITQPLGLKNIMWRREQFRSADTPDFCLALARQLVSGKIRNCRTLLMRNHVTPPAATLKFLKAIDFETRRAEDLSQLLGLEGVAARSYFEEFSGMLKTDQSMEDPDSISADSEPRTSEGAGLRFDFKRRNRRPPRDPINAMLSLGYSLLAKDLTIACMATGLDPYLGFYHQPRYGRPALALDLMEPFRPLIVDSAVLSAVNQRMVTERDFIMAGDSVGLTPSGRKGFFRAYEARMDQLVTHPLFGYRVSYRRLLEIQVRLLARVLLGELREYPVFVTR